MILAKITIGLVAENEVGQFNFYLEREHYLESSRFAGQSLRYVAEVDGQWVALLTFSAPALHLKGRERLEELAVVTSGMVVEALADDFEELVSGAGLRDKLRAGLVEEGSILTEYVLTITTGE